MLQQTSGGSSHFWRASSINFVYAQLYKARQPWFPRKQNFLRPAYTKLIDVSTNTTAPHLPYSTVTDFARFLGLSISVPLLHAA